MGRGVAPKLIGSHLIECELIPGGAIGSEGARRGHLPAP